MDAEKTLDPVVEKLRMLPLAEQIKVIFLDVDGVLNSTRNVIADGGYPFPATMNADGTGAGRGDGKDPRHAESNLDRLAIGMIRKLCKEFDAVIVLSSTWRLHVDAIAFGKKYDLPIVDHTASCGKPESIKLYLHGHPEILNYIVIDDDQMNAGNRQVWTSVEEGFLYEHYEICRKKLAMAHGMGKPGHS